jgi:SagB-type dehydrogenase family enzyme
MSNRDLQAAWRYHGETKHSYQSIRSQAHFLDWANQPLPFKVYPGVEVMPLPREVPQAGMAALAAIAETGGRAGEAVPDLNALARLLYFSAGITRRRAFPGGEIYFRAASCTGALYEVELYVACRDLPGLEAGLYHFSPAEFGLRRLRSGDWRGTLVQATGGTLAAAQAPVIVICTCIYWRNAWKYQARTYRHFGWDNGTLLANLLAMAAALHLPATVLCGFVDDEVNRLVDADTEREVAFSLVALGRTAEAAPPPPGEAGALNLEVLPVSRKEMDYPLMRETHAASSLAAAEVAAWGGGLELPLPEAGGRVLKLEPLGDDEMPRDPTEQVILRRGSSRQFAREAVGFRQFSTMLLRSSRGFAADFHLRPEALLNHMYVIVNAVEGVEPGAYVFHPERGELELLRAGEFRNQAAYLGLEQELPGDAAFDVFYLSEMPQVLERFGNRGYRAAQLEAGVLGGKLYLAAYAQRLGATGLTFYDDDVVSFFSPHAQGKSAIFLMAAGRSAKRR